MIKISLLLGVSLGLTVATDILAQQADKSDILSTIQIEKIDVWGDSLSSSDTGYTSPNSILLLADMLSINAVTTEDLVKYEPSLVIRRRYIGDSNGTLGMRGSNMFQTPRSMVYADGVPLHFLLQTGDSGAPRWTMVSASEIGKIEVLYGPFSAEHSGNAMGGVVLVETGIPQKEEFHADISGFTQAFDAYGFDDDLSGYKGFVSYGNKCGRLSYYLSFNRLDNDAQPKTFRAATTATSGNVTEPAVDGGINGVDSRNREVIWYGDTGAVSTTTNNYKLKLGFDLDTWNALLNIAFEDRDTMNVGNSYIKDQDGELVWNGSNLIDGSNRFSFLSTQLNESLGNRESLSLGMRLKGYLNKKFKLEINLNRFYILTHESRDSQTNPADPDDIGLGQINAYDNSGWATAEIKLTTHDVFTDNLQLITGIRHENYELNLKRYSSTDYIAGIKGNKTSLFGGKTKISALFVQANLALNEQWDFALGARYEGFKGNDGYYSETNNNGLELIFAPSTSVSKISPKLSIGYKWDQVWSFRYSLAKASRFPIVQELFRQYETYNTINEANPELKPEDGLHHNLLAERALDNGYLRINLFHEEINDVITSQSTITSTGASINTFVPLDNTETSGIEFILNKYDLLENLDIRFNLSYTDAEIIRNDANPQLEGNTYPRMPKWRSNIITTYHFSRKWNLGLTVQYASDSYGRIQNDDHVNQVYGAQDAYTRIGIKSNYQINNNISVSLGIDNLSNEITYVGHPWSGRTAYLSFAYDM